MDGDIISITIIPTEKNQCIKYKKNKTKIIVFIVTVLMIISFINGFSTPLPKGLSIESPPHNLSSIEFLHDLTYEKDGETVYEQNIFNKQLDLIRNARKFIVIDMFLFNDDYNRKNNFPEISKNLTDTLINQKKKQPNLKVIFITDEINNFYGAYESKFIKKLKNNQIDVVITDSTKIKDSNPAYSGFWRAFIQWFGVEGKGWIKNPFGSNAPKVTLRSYLKLLNFKANHRKVLITEDAAIISSSNPHDASGYHSNIAFRVKGDIVNDILQSELAVAKLSGADVSNIKCERAIEDNLKDIKATLLTEEKIRKNLVNEIKKTKSNDKINMGMFYLSDRIVIKELINASNRGVEIKLILDANKDAFGIEKNGIPNRPVAAELIKKTNNNIKIKWYKTQGEQYHTKITHIEKENQVVIIGGSANLTRRNIGGYNLEANLKIETSKNNIIAQQVSQYFERIWDNRDGVYTVSYSEFQEEKLFKYLIYRIQEWSGLSTF